MKLSRYCLPILTALTLTVGCEDEKMRLSCEKVTLNNGLTVLLCQEGYAPVVTVGVLYHVGCNREEKGKTGFAHLFEHLMFSESQHVPPKVAWKLIQGLGGTMNGWTSVDHTFYHETVPVSGMEDAMWMEADRMGYLVISECPDWRMDFLNPEACRRFNCEFREILLRDRDVPIVTDSRLAEMSFGSYEGQENSFDIPDCPINVLFFHPELYTSPPGGAESLDDLFARTGAFLRARADPLLKEGTDVLIVGHGAMNSSIVCQVRGLPRAQFWSAGIDNCKLMRLS